MRLVDVDELIEYFDGDLEGYDNREYILHMLDSKGRSARVDAIPIELIKKEMKRLDDDIKWAWYYGNVALDKMEYLKTWLTIKLEDWEKENETN